MGTDTASPDNTAVFKSSAGNVAKGKTPTSVSSLTCTFGTPESTMPSRVSIRCAFDRVRSTFETSEMPCSFKLMTRGTPLLPVVNVEDKTLTVKVTSVSNVGPGCLPLGLTAAPTSFLPASTSFSLLLVGWCTAWLKASPSPEASCTTTKSMTSSDSSASTSISSVLRYTSNSDLTTTRNVSRA